MLKDSKKEATNTYKECLENINNCEKQLEEFLMLHKEDKLSDDDHRLFSNLLKKRAYYTKQQMNYLFNK